MKKTIISLLCGLTLMTGAALANAGTITYGPFSNDASTNWTADLAFQKFDPTLFGGGWLTGISFNLSGRAYGDIQLENTSASTGNIWGSVGATISVLNPLDINEFLVQVLPTQSVTHNGVAAYDGNTNYAGNSGFTDTVNSGVVTNTGSTTDALLLAYFTGIGPASVTTNAQANNQSGGNTGNLASNFNTHAWESLSITYNYANETVVPEPGTFLLLGGGLLGVGLAARLRKKK